MTLTVLENIVVLVLDIRLWTGRKKLRPEDLAANGIRPGQLPPGTLASLGNKRVIGNEALAPFMAIKREAEKTCLAKGVRFLGGYAVPADEAATLVDKLAELRTAFDRAKADLLQRYDEEIHRWIAENPPEWAPIIRAAVDPVSHVQKALSFNYAPVAISAPEGMEESEELEAQAQGLYGQLCHEVRVAAQVAFDASYVGRASVTRKALRPIQAIREKLCALVFLDPLVSEMIHTIDDTLARLPRTGPIEGSELNMLGGLLSRELARMGQAIGSEEEIEESLEEIDFSAIPPFTVTMTQMAMPLSWDF